MSLFAPLTDPATGPRGLRLMCSIFAAMTATLCLTMLVVVPTETIDAAPLALGVMLAVVVGVLARGLLGRAELAMGVPPVGDPAARRRALTDPGRWRRFHTAVFRSIAVAEAGVLIAVGLALTVGSVWWVIGAGPLTVAAVWSLRGQVPAGLVSRND